MKWYHHYLCHPGEARMYKTLASTLYWEKMENEIRQFVKQCPTCQRFKKKKKKKYGKLLPKNVELIPWDTVFIGLVSPYTTTDQKGNDRILNAMIFKTEIFKMTYICVLMFSRCRLQKYATNFFDFSKKNCTIHKNTTNGRKCRLGISGKMWH